MAKETWVLAISSFIFLFSVSMVLIGNSRITGYATTGTTVSNVTIQKYLSIAMSTNLSQGIMFGTITNLPALYTNASHNNDSADGTGNTTMYVNVSTDSNTPVDFCIKANASLSDGGDTLVIGNETYSNSTVINGTYPLATQNLSLSTSYAVTGKNIAVGGANYYRFWLNVPVSQPSGTYINQLTFEGIQTGGGC